MWVGKFDGSLQCGIGEATPIIVAEAELKHVVGEVRKSEKRHWPHLIPQACGLPTGSCYAFEVDDKAAADHANELKAKHFFPWPTDDKPAAAPAARGGDGVPFPYSTTPSGEWSPFPLSVRREDWAPFPFGMRRGDDGFFPWGVTGQLPSIQSLVGKLCRLYRTGDPLTKDYRPDRANIEINAEGRIVSVWFG